MFYLFLKLVLVPFIVLATFGEDVTWFALFVGEAAVVALYFVVKKFSKSKFRVFSLMTAAAQVDDVFNFGSNITPLQAQSLPTLFDYE
ncbi:hypothetical protein [Alteromonas gilva]|uniref:Uncharacterized protein n=1 Tax=Alteromonas gilva TaxID=2987522 RepID=A0ABT5L9N1_9ALTE|nr:hypothetical protein [Alteromonas gilva]MDC8832837.1 hypothetical protein [Alteromonas gilva]